MAYEISIREQVRLAAQRYEDLLAGVRPLITRPVSEIDLTGRGEDLQIMEESESSQM